MKHKLLSSLILLIAFSATAQIPNNSFETWLNTGLAVEPQGWSTSNTTYKFIDMFAGAFGANVNHPTTVVKDAAHQAGSFSIKLQNVVGTEDGLPSDTVPGYAGLGTLSTSGTFGDAQDKSGIPFTQRPTALTGYYKFNQGAPNGSPSVDTAYIIWGVSKWNDALKIRETVGYGQKIIYETQSTFTPFTVDISYLNGSTPDTLTIFLMSSGAEVMYPNTTFNVDALAISGVTAIHTSLTDVTPVRGYPNPASTILNLENLPKGTQTIEVKDMTGRVVKNVRANSAEVAFSVEELSSGFYFYNAKTENGDVLYTGKFDVKN